MSKSNTRDKVLEEIHLIPENKLAEVYDFLHYFRLGLKEAAGKTEDVMKFAGSWKDMPEETFNSFYPGNQ